VIKNYGDMRDIPGKKGTSRISMHLRFGTVSIREVTKIALKHSESWLNELIWRNFYQVIIWHFPKSAERAFRQKYEAIPWRNDKDEFDAWCKGETGYPIVDAGMRELNTTGFMHNRVRMVVASFLTKHLLIDWRWGEAYFAAKLLDYELASNNGGWQWAAGSGCDAAPYFRVFNPESQMKKFDPDFIYVKKWVPEFRDSKYPEPIVPHKEARNRALSTYKSALS
jgi:deoxyribodipyrimidine photo-lyase